MAERDSTPVKVTLDRQRPYRANQEDRQAILVGPGEVEVPTWVAQEWGLLPKDAGSLTFSQSNAAEGSIPSSTDDLVEQITQRVLERLKQDAGQSPAESATKKSADIPADAVSATVETVKEEPLQTTETVEEVPTDSAPVESVPDDSKAPAKGKKAD